MVLNKWVVEIKKDFGLLVTCGLLPFLSPNEDVLTVEQVTYAIQYKIQTSTELPGSSATPMVDDGECEIYPLS